MKKQIIECFCMKCNHKQKITIGTIEGKKTVLFKGNPGCEKCGSALYFTAKLLPTKKFVGVIEEDGSW